MTKGRADPALAKILVDNSREAVQWLMDNGARFVLSFNRQAFHVDGKHKYWGGMVLNMDGEIRRQSSVSSVSYVLFRPGQGVIRIPPGYGEEAWSHGLFRVPGC